MYRFTRVLFANYRRFGNVKNQIDFAPKFPKNEPPTKLFLMSGIMAFFETKKEELEKQESDLIMAIKRGLFGTVSK